MIAALRRAGADLGARNANGSTAAILAAQFGHVPVLEELIAAGVAVDAPDENGWTPEMFAAHQGHDAAVAALVAARGGERQDATERGGEREEARPGGDPPSRLAFPLAVLVATVLSLLGQLALEIGGARGAAAPAPDAAELRKMRDRERDLSVEVEIERSARDEAERATGRARADSRTSTASLEARLAAATAAAAVRERRSGARESKLLAELRSTRAKRERERSRDVDALLGVDVASLKAAVLARLTAKLPALLQAVTREQLRREMLASSPQSPPRVGQDPDQASECIVCLEAARVIAFGCGHLCVCDDCAHVVGDCPICRIPITERRRIFNS